MSRRSVAISTALVLPLLCAPFSALAQQAGKVYRIGFLGGGSSSASAHLVDALRQGLRERGWVEGQNLVIEFRSPEGKLERLPDLAADLIRLKVDVIVSSLSPAIRAAKQQTSTIPIVMAGVNDAVGAGFVASLARPGGNVTGLSMLVTELSGKRLSSSRRRCPTSRGRHSSGIRPNQARRSL